MKDLLTIRAKSAVKSFGTWIRVCAFLFIAYALSKHMGWVDATAVTLAFGQILRTWSKSRQGEP